MPDSVHAENVIRLAEYYPDLNFGFASGALALKGELFAECSDRPGFNALEVLPDQFFAASEYQLSAWKKRFKVIHCGSLLDRALVRLIPGAEPAIRSDFLRTVEEILTKMQEIGIPSGILDFGLAGVLPDPEKKKELCCLLAKLHPILHKTERTLMLPVHLPFNDESMVRLVTGFLQEMMMGQLKICLQIYPHELGRDFSPRASAGLLRLETAQVRFCYNADCSNTLVRAHLVPWLRYLSLVRFTGPILFCPYSRDNRLAVQQSKACSLLAEELIKSE